MTVGAKQFFAALLAAVAMIVATVPACACSHHEPKAEVKAEASSCHHHTEQPAKENADSSSFCSSDGCICAAPLTIAVEKSSSVKIKKNAVVAAENKPVEIVITPVPSAPAIYLANLVEPETPAFNILRLRGPPRL